MQFPPLVEGRFIKRLNRFAALVDVDKRECLTHVPNSGRMEELLVPGFRVLLIPAPEGTTRKTAFDLALVDIGTTLSSADARLPNKLVAEAIAEGTVAAVRRVSGGASRKHVWRKPPGLPAGGTGGVVLRGDQVGYAGGGRRWSFPRRAHAAGRETPAQPDGGHGRGGTGPA